MAGKHRKLFITIRIVAGILLGLVLLFRLSTYHPKQVQSEAVHSRGSAPSLRPGQPLKVLNWNLQYMAGKNYVFFYDEWDGSGPDKRPSRADIEATWAEVLRVIRDENPDILILQELHVGSASTDKEDQVKRLVDSLPPEYAYWTAAWYWKAAFVPHPRIMGSAGMKLAIISKYKIDSAIRHQLPLMPNDPLTRHLNFKRAVLEARLPVEGGRELALMSIHMDAFAQGSDTMERQVEYVVGLLEQTGQAGRSFAIAGDFNLVPPGLSYSRLPDDEKPMFKSETEISRLYDRWRGYPTLAQADGPDWQDYLTHFPNIRDRPDRILDYYFVSDDLKVDDFYVRLRDTLHVSDHFPTVLNFRLP